MPHQDRKQALMPAGIPRYVRVYDNRRTSFETTDHITVVFTKKRIGKRKGEHPHPGQFMIIGLSDTQHFGHTFCDDIPDWPSYSHLGRRIRFQDLNGTCQRTIIDEYMDLWGISPL